MALLYCDHCRTNSFCSVDGYWRYPNSSYLYYHDISYSLSTRIRSGYSIGLARSTSLGASRGLLVKDRQALEIAPDADVMILDKTGTLTTGEFKVLDVKLLITNIIKRKSLPYWQVLKEALATRLLNQL